MKRRAKLWYRSLEETPCVLSEESWLIWSCISERKYLAQRKYRKCLGYLEKRSSEKSVHICQWRENPACPLFTLWEKSWREAGVSKKKKWRRLALPLKARNENKRASLLRRRVAIRNAMSVIWNCNTSCNEMLPENWKQKAFCRRNLRIWRRENEEKREILLKRRKRRKLNGCPEIENRSIFYRKLKMSKITEAKRKLWNILISTWSSLINGRLSAAMTVGREGASMTSGKLCVKYISSGLLSEIQKLTQ